MRSRRCLEDEEEAGSGDAGLAGASAGPAILIPSAGGFLGYQDGGGPTQGTGFRIIGLLGPHYTRDTHTHGMAIGNTDGSCKK